MSDGPEVASGVGGDPAALAAPVDAAQGAACRNCGALVSGLYCPECGQRAADPNPTLRELVHELAGEVLHWDGKLWTTASTLVRAPGALTEAYLSGQRARYLSPLRLYLAASVLYFFTSAVAPRAVNEKPLVTFSGVDRAASASSSATRGASGQVVAPLSVEARDTSASGLRGFTARTGARASEGVKRAVRDQQAFTTRLRAGLGTLVFLILPAFAFAVGVAYRKQGRHYPQHVIFALHVHGVVFLVLVVADLARFTRHAHFGTAADIVALLLIAVYVVAALRRVYGGSWPATIVKSVLLSVVYLSIFAVGMGGLVFYNFLTF